MEQAWTAVMQKHAKSFHLASQFFPRKVLPKVQALYALCRWIDDAVDEAPDVHTARKRLAQIEEDLTGPCKMKVNALYLGQGLEIGYILDLMEGARDDLGEVLVQDADELVQYSYKVAGAVGLAMCDLMQVPDPRARAFAVDLGIAMQMTNICRDVKEDWRAGRVYLPKTFLERHAVDIHSPAPAVRDTLQLADRYYASAAKAFPAIPFRVRGAIIVASELYRGIGLKLGRKWNWDAMRGRCMLGSFEKLWHLGWGCSHLAFSCFRRGQLVHDCALHRPLKKWAKIRRFA